MRISVFMVCFNAAATIRGSLESFMAQDYQNKELVLIDGASKDDTLAIAQEFAGPNVIIVSEPDKGMYDALNKALARYTGDAFGILNADDRYARDDILSQVAVALEQYDAIGGNVEFVSSHETGQVLRRWRGSDRPANGFRSGWMPAHPTFYARRALATQVGDFDPSYRICGDYDWMLRALELQPTKYRHIDMTYVKMLTGGLSTSGLKSKIAISLECLRSRQRWLGAGPVDFALAAKPLRQLSSLFGR
jgi:glycosyltransferase involved in cell wall biosynthesis